MSNNLSDSISTANLIRHTNYEIWFVVGYRLCRFECKHPQLGLANPTKPSKLHLSFFFGPIIIGQQVGYESKFQL